MFYVRRSDGYLWTRGRMGFGFHNVEPDGEGFADRAEAERARDRISQLLQSQGFSVDVVELAS